MDIYMDRSLPLILRESITKGGGKENFGWSEINSESREKETTMKGAKRIYERPIKGRLSNGESGKGNAKNRPNNNGLVEEAEDGLVEKRKAGRPFKT